MKRSIQLLATVAFFQLSRSAFGQFSVADQSRSLSTSGSSDSTTSAGTYTKTLTYDTTGTYSDQAGSYNVTSGAQQNSLVSPSLLSGNGSANALTLVTPTGGLNNDFTKSDGQSIYNVDFTVAAPTPFTLTGNISGSANYILGRLPTTAANVTLTSSLQTAPLYSVSEDYGDGTGLTFYNYPVAYNDPVSYTTILEPGQTYTLNAEAYTDSTRYADAEGNESSPGAAAFSFAATVPEPWAMSWLAPAVVLITMRARHRAASSPATSLPGCQPFHPQR
jgi:hypothetical protein